jgi:hypothetical protein
MIGMQVNFEEHGITRSNFDAWNPSLEVVDDIWLYKFIGASTSTKSLVQRVSTLINRAGFTHFSYVLFSANRRDVSCQTGNYQKKISDLYMAENFQSIDFMLDHLNVSNKPVFYSELRQHLECSPTKSMLFEKNLEIAKLYESFEIYDYYMIPFAPQRGGAGCFCITAQGASPEYIREKIRLYDGKLKLLAKAIDHVGTQKFADFPITVQAKEKLINAKPLLLLEALANHNITLNEAAERLHISISTANQQIAAAKKALGANTTTNAILQAIKLGLIELDD